MKNPMISASEAHQKYTESIEALSAMMTEPVLRRYFLGEIDDFVRCCTLGVWHADNAAQISEHHVAFYNAIYNRTTTSPHALYWEVASGVANFQEIKIPRFFSRMREYDDLTHRFLDQLTLLLLLFAAADGVIRDSEAAFINQCSDRLLALCQSGGTITALRADEFVTEPQTADPKQNPEPEETLDDILAQLDDLCGLDRVKRDVKSLINLVKVRKLRQESGLPVPPMSLHMVFLGNPGTGKTTVARLLAKIYRAIGILSKGQLVEVDRSGLVAGYVGQTAIKTNEAVQKALGGVLFLDEAYALANQDNANDFGHEAIEVLLKNMEDHRDDFIVIAAGYTGPMEAFIHANPGLESRFNKYFFFDDYNGEQLMQIFQSMCEKNGYTLSDAATQQARELLELHYQNRDEHFGNARDVRNLFETTVARQSDRIARLETTPTREQLMELLPEDLDDPDDPNDNREDTVD